MENDCYIIDLPHHYVTKHVKVVLWYCSQWVPIVEHLRGKVSEICPFNDL